MSSPAVLAFAHATVNYLSWYLDEIDRNRRTVRLLIIELENLEVVDLVLYCPAMVMLSWLEFWLGVEMLYYEVWWTWCHGYVLLFDPNVEEDPDEDEDEDMDEGEGKQKGGGLFRDVSLNCRDWA